MSSSSQSSVVGDCEHPTLLAVDTSGLLSMSAGSTRRRPSPGENRRHSGATAATIPYMLGRQDDKRPLGRMDCRPSGVAGHSGPRQEMGKLVACRVVERAAVDSLWLEVIKEIQGVAQAQRIGEQSGKRDSTEPAFDGNAYTLQLDLPRRHWHAPAVRSACHAADRAWGGGARPEYQLQPNSAHDGGPFLQELASPTSSLDIRAPRAVESPILSLRGPNRSGTRQRTERVTSPSYQNTSQA
jgi:hypothetical protein